MIQSLVRSLAGAISAALAGGITSGGLITGAGFRSSTPGTPGAPSYSWVAKPDQGLFDDLTRVGLSFGGADKAYWGASNHNYVATSIASALTVSGGDISCSGGDLIMATGRNVVLNADTNLADLPLQFAGRANLGLYSTGDTQWRAVANGGAVHGFYASTSGAMGNLVCSNAIEAQGLIDARAGIYLLEQGAAPSALANYSIMYSIDVAGKTQLNAKQGAAGTVTPLAIEV